MHAVVRFEQAPPLPPGRTRFSILSRSPFPCIIANFTPGTLALQLQFLSEFVP